ncbi:hypothetical protein [Streptomyces viridosporus]|nr:hypothetical protein [Streptomyces viridosporus]
MARISSAVAKVSFSTNSRVASLTYRLSAPSIAWLRLLAAGVGSGISHFS